MLVLTDTLSRAPLSTLNVSSPTEFYVFRVGVDEPVKQPNLGLTSPTAEALQAATATDPETVTLCHFICTGWTNSRKDLPESMLPRLHLRDELSLTDGIVYHGLQAVTPQSMQSSMLAKIRSSHMGPKVFFKYVRIFCFGQGCIRQ